MGRKRKGGSPLTLFAFQDIITATTGILILITLILCFYISKQPQRTAEISEHARITNEQLRRMEVELTQLRTAVDRMQEQAMIEVGLSPSEAQLRVDQSASAVSRLQDLLHQAEQKHQTASAAMNEAETHIKSTLATDLKQLEQIRQAIASYQDRTEQLRDGNRIVYNFRKSQANPPWLLQVDETQLLAARSGRAQAPIVFNDPSTSRRLRSFEQWLDRLPEDDRYFVVLVRPSGTEMFSALGTEGIRPALERANARIGIDLLSETQAAIDPIAGAGN